MTGKEYENAIRAIVPESFFQNARVIVDSHKPSNQIYEKIELRLRLSHQDIVQLLCALQSIQYNNKKAGDPIDHDLEDLLREEIAAKGGVEAIDKWLIVNDPGHKTPSSLKKLDWSWFKK